MNTCHRREQEEKRNSRSLNENSAAASSAKKSREEYPVLEAQPSSPPSQAIRSSYAPQPQSPHPTDPAAGARTESFPAEAYHNPSSQTPSRRSSRQTGNCAVPARAERQHPCSSRRRRIHATLLESPCQWRLDGGCRVSMRRRVGVVVAARLEMALLARPRGAN